VGLARIKRRGRGGKARRELQRMILDIFRALLCRVYVGLSPERAPSIAQDFRPVLQ
jgi:hypothetical protein